MIALWAKGSTSMYSDVFNIAPGKVCVLYASDLELERCRVSNDEFKGMQVVCVRKLVHTANVSFLFRDTWCDWVAVPQNASAIVDSVVQINGCCWELTPTNNLRIIGVPGTYRLEINDCTAIGTAQVYADLFSVEQLPHQIAHLFF